MSIGSIKEAKVLSAIHHEEHLEKSLTTFDSILKSQTSAINHLVYQYKYSQFSQNQLTKSLNILNSTLLKGGKIVITGVGKSHKIASKIVATLNSLSLHSALLHPSEALHGDLGIIRKENNDCVIFISSSGKSPELIQLLPHISPETPIVLLTNKKSSLLSQHFQVNSLLYAELPPQLTEESIYGLTAPTISTTLCLTLADAVSIALVELYISDYNERKKVFGERHPGGAIGEAYATSAPSSLGNFSNYLSYSSSSLSSTGNSSNTAISPALNPVSSLDEDDEDTLRLISNHGVTFEIGSEEDQPLSYDEQLIANIKESKRTIYFEHFFKDEAAVLHAIALYDFIVFREAYAISSEKLKELFRFVVDQNYETSEERFQELTWRIKSSLSGYRS